MEQERPFTLRNYLRLDGGRAIGQRSSSQSPAPLSADPPPPYNGEGAHAPTDAVMLNREEAASASSAVNEEMRDRAGRLRLKIVKTFVFTSVVILLLGSTAFFAMTAVMTARQCAERCGARQVATVRALRFSMDRPGCTPDIATGSLNLTECSDVCEVVPGFCDDQGGAVEVVTTERSNFIASISIPIPGLDEDAGRDTSTAGLDEDVDLEYDMESMDDPFADWARKRGLVRDECEKSRRMNDPLGARGQLGIYVVKMESQPPLHTKTCACETLSGPCACVTPRLDDLFATRPNRSVVYIEYGVDVLVNVIPTIRLVSGQYKTKRGVEIPDVIKAAQAEAAGPEAFNEVALPDVVEFPKEDAVELGVREEEESRERNESGSMEE